MGRRSAQSGNDVILMPAQTGPADERQVAGRMIGFLCRAESDMAAGVCPGLV
jgi:hypothetical protein